MSLEWWFEIFDLIVLWLNKISMGNNSAKTQRRVLVIANTSITTTHVALANLAKNAKHNPLYKIYSFARYPQGETILIEPTDEKTLEQIELVLVIGENADLLFSFSLFVGRHSPPIYGIGNTEDFTTPNIFSFTFCHFEDTEYLVFHESHWDHLPWDDLMKLQLAVDCKKVGEATCQVQVHRGMNKAILIINIYIENSCMDEKIKIGQFRGDGLLISTPMGSLCKSLSLNGPLMDRNMQLILITPICPLTMKFRPLCLPATTNIFLDIDESCRTEEADIYIDENSKYAKLKKGELLSIKLSKFTTRLVSTLIETTEQFFIRSLNNTLGWGKYYNHIEQLPIRRQSSIE